jgi:hypothetical protein
MCDVEITNAIEPEIITEVPASTSSSLADMVDAKLPALTKKFKGTEEYMAKGGLMRQRDVYYVLPTTAVDYPSPEEHSLGLSYANDRAMGKIFSGKNRKERRAAFKNKR